jgi:hypothetical protein
MGVANTLAYNDTVTTAAIKKFKVKTFQVCNLRMFVISSSVFFPGKPFWPSLMFASKARAYPRIEPFKGSTNFILG